MKQKILVLLLALMCLFGMTGCSLAPEPVGENVIKNDVICQDDTIYSSDMHLVSFQISKRQTNPDQKTDFVWVDITAENEHSRYIAACKLSYTLYNEGWLLDTYEVLEESLEYVNGLDPAVALARANEFMDQYYAKFSTRNKGVVELVNLSMQGEFANCLFDHAEQMGENGLLTLHWRFNVLFRLTENGWSKGTWDGTMREAAYDWNLLGEWRGSNGGETFILKVHSYDPQNRTVDVEYVFGSLCSNGRETLHIVNQDFWDREQKEWSLNEDRSAHHGFIDLYPFGKTYTDAGEGVGILADSGNVHCWLSRVD